MHPRLSHMTDKVMTTENSRTILHLTSHTDALGLKSDPASSSSLTHAKSAAADCLAHRTGEATRQAATLATWEGEGGTTANVE